MKINQVYQITIKGRLDPKWEDWFDGFKIEPDADTTKLTGMIRDQSALYGIFNKLRDLGFIIITVIQIENN